jgi:head-tail joining protein
MSIGELNVKVIVKHYTTVQDGTTGKTDTTLTDSWEKWAKVERTTGSRILDNASVTYKESYTVTVRYDASRPTLSKYNIEFGGNEMKIYSSVPEKIGKREWETITCYTQV